MAVGSPVPVEGVAVSVQHEDGSISLQQGEGINLGREIDWVVNDWMPDDRYTGAIIFESYGRCAGYALWPINERDGREAA